MASNPAMRSVQSVHILAMLQIAYGLAHFVGLKSTKPWEFTDLVSGCSSTSIQLCYQCTRELNDTSADLPQVFSFRVDCRGAKGNFQNLTLFDSNMVCGHLTYRKYGNGSLRNPTSRLPFVSDHVVTIEKGDILDFQCVLRSLEMYSGHERRHSSSPQNPEKIGFSPKFELIRDGVTWIYYTPVNVDLLCLSGDRRPCIQSLAKAYEWKMTVAKSKGLTYWVSFGTSVLQPQVLDPPVEFSSELQGEIYRLDKDLLRLEVVEVTSYNSWKKPQDTLQKLVELDDNFYGDGAENNHSFSVDFKMRVNPDLLRSDTKDVVVILRLQFRPEKETYFHVVLPINRHNSSSLWPWLTPFLIFLAAILAVAYVFREQLFMLQAFQLLWRRSAGLPLDEGVGIELQS